jgi:hypothetical protein
VPLAQLGLPPSIALTGSTTVVPVVAPNIPDTKLDGSGSELVVRMQDGTAASGILHILPLGSSIPAPPAPDPGGGGEQPREIGEGLRRPIYYEAARGGFVLDLPQASDARLEVFDLQGRRVRKISAAALPQGTSVVPWDQRTDDGTRLGPGLYFARLTARGGAWTARVPVGP